SSITRSAGAGAPSPTPSTISAVSAATRRPSTPRSGGTAPTPSPGDRRRAGPLPLRYEHPRRARPSPPERGRRGVGSLGPRDLPELDHGRRGLLRPVVEATAENPALVRGLPGQVLRGAAGRRAHRPGRRRLAG